MNITIEQLKKNFGAKVAADIEIGNFNVSKSEEWKNVTGAFIDDSFLIDYLTPEEYFHFVGKMYGLKKDEVDERISKFNRFMNGEVIGQKKCCINRKY